MSNDSVRHLCSLVLRPVSQGGDFVAPGVYIDVSQLNQCPYYLSYFELYIEGRRVSQALGDAWIKVWLDPDGPGPAGYVHDDTVRVTVVNVDLDIDSDNDDGTGAPDRSPQEDRLEDWTDHPGKLLVVNDDDDDEDDVVDYGDGFNLDTASPSPDDANDDENDFVPIVFEVKAPIDLDVATVRVRYNASDPSEAQLVGDPPEVVLPEDGLLRIWSVRGTGDDPDRDKRRLDQGGHYVAPYEQDDPEQQWVYTAAQFGLTNEERDVTLYVEAVKPSTSLEPERIIFEVDPDGPFDEQTQTGGRADFVATDVVQAMVFKVVSLQWQTHEDNWVIDACPNNGGKRVYPDASAYDDPDPGKRPWVEVKATITPVAEGVTVYFKEWDVDDPFDQNNPTWLDVDQVDNDAIGPDNRGTHEFPPGWRTASSDASGTAVTWFKVSMQPGDNFCMAATTTPELLDNRMVQADAESVMPGGGDVAGARVTEMLTVWRHSWLELDSMGPGSGYCEDGPEWDPSPVTEYADNWAPPHEDDYSVKVHNSDSPTGVFENGKLTFYTEPSPAVLVPLESRWTVDGTLYFLAEDPGAGIVGTDTDVCDDDLDHVPRKVDTSLLPLRFLPAYVSVSEESGVSDMDLPFIANNDGYASTWASLYSPPYRDRTTSPEFWSIQIVSAFQGLTSEDGDPGRLYHVHSLQVFKEGEPTVLGETPVAGAPGGENNMVLIYLEDIRDAVEQTAFMQSWGSWPYGIDTPTMVGLGQDEVERGVTVHEVGHAFGCDHQDMGIMMAGGHHPDLKFTGISLAKIRSEPWIGVP